MKFYADSSFLVKLLAHELGFDSARAEFQRLGHPCIPFLPLHRLETLNAIRQKALRARQSADRESKSQAFRVRDSALARVVRWQQRGWLIEKAPDWASAVEFACDLSARHADRLGARSLDLLHVAFALHLNAEVFLTTDSIQSAIASAEGFEVPDLIE